MNTRHDETNKECKLNITIQEGRNGHKYALQLGVSNEDWVNLNCSCRPPEQYVAPHPPTCDCVNCGTVSKEDKEKFYRMRSTAVSIPTPKDTREEEELMCGCPDLDSCQELCTIPTDAQGLREEWEEYSSNPYYGTHDAFDWWLAKVEEARSQHNQECHFDSNEERNIALDSAHHQWIERVREHMQENKMTDSWNVEVVSIDTMNTFLTDMDSPSDNNQKSV